MKFNVIGRSVYGKLQYQVSNIEKRSNNFNEWKLPFPMKEYYKKMLSLVDEAVGFSQIAEAQALVLKYEQQYEEVRNKVYAIKQTMEEKQDLLSEMRRKLDRCDRHDERYLLLVADEHKILLSSRQLLRDFNAAEQQERQMFRLYSGAVRLSHERERLNGQRTKYWSIIASIGGTILGFTFSSLITHSRLEGMSSVTQSAISQVLLEMHATLEEHQTSMISQLHSLNEAVIKNEGDVSSDTKGSAAVKKIEHKIEEVISFLKLLNENTQKLSVDNEKLLKELVERIIKYLSQSKKTQDIKVDNVQIEDHLETSIRATENTKVNSLNEDETILNTNLAPQENVGGSEKNLNSKSFNILLVLSTLSFVAISYWKELF
ncbi:mitochondrial potassium channel [Hydra vulgaris]|nr:mitochondrial potassium channel [Hydra vulgaris]XP_047138080.1 mitochondrial potassium channel [Hydra vulgaris]